VSGKAKAQEAAKECSNPQPYDSSLDGRLALYLNGYVRQQKTGWLTAKRGYARRPGEGPVPNFWPSRPILIPANRSRLLITPSFANDGCSARKSAPPLGKFTSKRAMARSTGMWGNLKVGYFWLTELAHVGPRPCMELTRIRVRNHHQLRRATAHGGWIVAQRETMAAMSEFAERADRSTPATTRDILTGSERGAHRNSRHSL